MERHTVTADINLICVRATSFPHGIKEAFEKLEKIVPGVMKRTFYGISQGSENAIVYWAATEESQAGEAAQALERFTIKKGNYAAVSLKNPMANEGKIKEIFSDLLTHPNLDRTAACVEWYKSYEEVMCMVRLTS